MPFGQVVDVLNDQAGGKEHVFSIKSQTGISDAFSDAHVLNHVADDGKAMSELHRVLKPGGWAIIRCPVDYNREQTFEDPTAKTTAERIKVLGQEDLARIYGKDFIDRLKHAGFNVNLDYYSKELGEEKTSRLGLLLNEEVYFCTKN